MRYPALALLEYESIADGIAAGDRMVKRAPISLLKCGTVHPGRYLIMLGGSVASVEESFREGQLVQGLLDAVFLPDVDEQVHDAALGERRSLESEALGILEPSSAPSLLEATEAARKGCRVDIAEIRLSDDLGGKAFALLDASLPEVASALELAEARLGEKLLMKQLLPRLDEDLRRMLDKGTSFAGCPLHEPGGAENVSG